MMQIRVLSIFAALIFCSNITVGQNVDTNIKGMQIVMDEVVVKAAKKGWDLAAFINKMKNDTTFYKAFLGLKVSNYTSDNEIKFYDDKNKLETQLENRTEQNMKGNCRTVRISNEKIIGKYYDKKKNPRYYTGELFENLFFRPRENECGQTDIIAKQPKTKGKLEQHKEQIKQLIFNPGSKVEGIPFVGKKASIFEEEKMQQRYNFSLKFEQYQGEECYVLRAWPKDEYKNEVVFNQLDTWFRITDFSIMARDYSLSYHTLLYDFDVKMKVRLEKNNAKLLPSTIEYWGNWHIFTKKRERAAFKIWFDY